MKSKEENVTKAIEKSNKQHLEQDNKVLCKYLFTDDRRWDSKAEKSVDELSV